MRSMTQRGAGWRAAYFAVFATVTIVAPVGARAETGYRTVQSVPLSGGSLRILEDARLMPALARELWRTDVDPVDVLGDDNPAAQTFKAKPLRPAKLRQIDAAGRVLLDFVPNPAAPLARIEKRRFGPASRPVYLVTTDDSAGAGSYSGFATTLFDTENGRLSQVQATDQDQKRHTINLISTLKSDWKVANADPAHTVIKQLLCRPDFDHQKPGGDLPFVLSYITYWSDGAGWRMARRDVPGFWENEGAWPSRSRFPKAGDR